jgi:hypothetical protein
MAIDFEFLKKLMKREPKDVYAKNWEKYEAAKLEESRIISEEKELSKQESEILDRQKNLELSSGISLNEYIDHPEDHEEQEVWQQAQAIIAAKKAIQTRKEQIITRKIQLETQMLELERLIKELKEKEAQIEEQTIKITNIKTQIEKEEHEIDKASQGVTPKKIEIRIDAAGRRIVALAAIIFAIFLLSLFIFAILYYDTYTQLTDTQTQLQNAQEVNNQLRGQISTMQSTINEKNNALQASNEEVRLTKEQVKSMGNMYTDLKWSLIDMNKTLTSTMAERNRYVEQAVQYSNEKQTWYEKYDQCVNGLNGLNTINGFLTQCQNSNQQLREGNNNKYPIDLVSVTQSGDSLTVLYSPKIQFPNRVTDVSVCLKRESGIFSLENSTITGSGVRLEDGVKNSNGRWTYPDYLSVDKVYRQVFWVADYGCDKQLYLINLGNEWVVIPAR